MAVTLHTNLGDMKCELFCDLAPRTCKNFLALAASNYYDGTIFHRSIKKFMLQGGDPSGTGKGGQSIYGKYFEDELNDSLKHDNRGVISMANRGPNTNGSRQPYERQIVTAEEQPAWHGSCIVKWPDFDSSPRVLCRGAEFFILYEKAAHLNNINTVFGKSVRRIILTTPLCACISHCQWLLTVTLRRRLSFSCVVCRIIHGVEVLDAIEKVPVDAKDRPMHEIKLLNITIHANPIAEQQR
jgi:peptidyl-prolyl cis-trans isomerase-like 3